MRLPSGIGQIEFAQLFRMIDRFLDDDSRAIEPLQQRRQIVHLESETDPRARLARRFAG